MILPFPIPECRLEWNLRPLFPVRAWPAAHTVLAKVP